MISKTIFLALALCAFSGGSSKSSKKDAKQANKDPTSAKPATDPAKPVKPTLKPRKRGIMRGRNSALWLNNEQQEPVVVQEQTPLAIEDQVPAVVEEQETVVEEQETVVDDKLQNAVNAVKIAQKIHDDNKSWAASEWPLFVEGGWSDEQMQEALAQSRLDLIEAKNNLEKVKLPYVQRDVKNANAAAKKANANLIAAQAQSDDAPDANAFWAAQEAIKAAQKVKNDADVKFSSLKMQLAKIQFNIAHGFQELYESQYEPTSVLRK